MASSRSRRAAWAAPSVAAAAVAFGFWATRPVGHDVHLDVVSRVQGLQELDARRDEQLIALRFGLSAQYDLLADVEERMRAELDALSRLAASPDHAADLSGLAPIERSLDEKSQAIDVFVEHLVSLKSAIHCFPKSLVLFQRAAEGGAHAELELRLARLSTDVFRTFAHDGARRRPEVAREIDALAASAPSLPAPIASALQPVLLQARALLDNHTAIDAELRTLLDQTDRGRMDTFLAGYIDTTERAEARVHAARLWVYAAAAALVFGVALALVRARFLKERIENEVRERTRELEQSRAQYRSLVESTQAVPWQWDASRGAFAYVGPQAGALLGCATDAWLAQGFLEARVHGEDSPRVLARLRGDAPASDELEFRLAHADGSWVWARCIVGTDAAEPGRRQGLILDVTERRRMEIELRQAQKLESVGRLAAGVAHEINTPVQFVGDSLEFVREAVGELLPLVERYQGLRASCERGAPDAAQLADLASAEDAADLPYLRENLAPALERSLDGLQRVGSIVRSLKEFAHPEQREQAPADLNRALTTALTISKAEYRLVADVVTELGELPPVTCLVSELNQVFVNLIVNAAHAIGDAVQARGGRGRITVRTRREGGEAVIEIEDDGGGIPEHVRARIFEPFFTTKDVGRGTGQGLAISRSVVVEKHGGTLSFETELGRGTTFVVRLPIDGSPVERPAVHAGAAA